MVRVSIVPAKNWYDVETGQQLLYLVTDYTHTCDYEWLEDFTQTTQFSHEAVMQGDNGNFYVEAIEETILTPKGSDNAEKYSHTYSFNFDKQNMTMCKQGYQEREMFEHFTQSNNKYIHDWAQEKIWHYDNPDLPEDEVVIMPEKKAMFTLNNTESSAFSFMQLNQKSLNEEQLYGLCDDINAQSGDSLADILNDYGIIEEDCHEFDTPWKDLQDVSCVIDSRTAYEREIYININFSCQNKRRGLLLISVLSDKWRFSEALMYSLPNGRTISINFLDRDKRIIYIPGKDMNGYPSTKACYQNGKIKFFFLSESYGSNGLHYICDTDRYYESAVNELCKFYVNVKDENDDSIAYISTHIWLPPDSEILFSEDKDLEALTSGDFEKHDRLMSVCAKSQSSQDRAS